MIADVQIAFQGGGARLADLLAAAEVLQKEEANRRIRITRVAGTSAGAIAAAVVACGNNSASKARNYLAMHGPRLVRTVYGTQPAPLKLASWRNAWRAFKGQPLLNPEGLNTAIYEVINEIFLPSLREIEDENAIRGRPGKITFGDVRRVGQKALFVVAADLETKGPAVLSADNLDLVKALVDSCALPFVFRGHRTLRNNPRVDGGLCANLPSDVLLDMAGGNGEVLAISFAADPGQASAPDGLLEYLQSLVATAINASVVRATDRLRRGATLNIKSNLSTFSFAEAFVTPSPDSGQRVMGETKVWVDKWLKGSLQIPSGFWDDAMEDILKWYYANQKPAQRHNIRSTLMVTARSWNASSVEEAEADDISKHWQFAPIKEPMSLFYVMVGPNLLPRDLTVRVFGPDRAPVEHRLLPARSRENGTGKPIYGYVLAFDSPLQPLSKEDVAAGLMYTIRVSYSQLGGVSGVISSERRDFIQHSNLRSDGYQSVDIVLRKPSGFNVNAVARWVDEREEGYAETITTHELEPHVLGPGWECLGWRVQNFPNGRKLRVDLHRV